MPRYSKSRSRTPPRRRRRRSYSSSSSSRSRSRSRSPLRGNPKYPPPSKKTTSRRRSYSRTPPRKDRAGGGYKSSSSKQRGRRSRSYTPEKHRAKSRSPHRNERYMSPQRSPQRGGRETSHQQSKTVNYRREEQTGSRAGYQEGAAQLHQDNQTKATEGPQLPPAFKEDFGRGIQVQDQLPLTLRETVYDRDNSQPGGSQSKYASDHPAERSFSKDTYRENEKTKYEAVSPDDLRFTPKSAQRSESPYDRKISKPKAEYYQVQEKYSQGDALDQGYKSAIPTEPQNAKMGSAQIIRPIFDAYAVKIPRRKDEGLKEIFDRPELKARFASEQMQPEGAPETQFAATAQKKEPVVYRQDVHFTGTLPGGTLPPQAHAFIERREPLIMGFEPRRDTYLDPNLQFSPRVNPVGLGSQYPGQSSGFQVQPVDQFGSVKEGQHIQDFNRQAMIINESSSMMGTSQSPVSYQYPPEDLPDIKGPHDLRHDLESRRKQMEQQQGRIRSASRSRSRSRSRRMSPLSRPRGGSRSRSCSPIQQYKSYQHRQSQSREHSEGQRIGDRRPVRERLGNVSQGTGDSSFSDGDNDRQTLKWSQKLYHHDRREDRSKSRDRDSRDRDSRDRDNYSDNTNKYRGSMRGSYRGARGRGYLGKNFIPGYNRTFHNNNRGKRGRYLPRGGRGFLGEGRSPTWTHDLFDKEKDEGDGAVGKRNKKKLKTEKGKDKKAVKQKGKTVKKTKKTKKSPTRSQPGQQRKDVLPVPASTNTTS